MNRIRPLILLSTAIFCMACTNDLNEQELLRDAAKTVDTDPKEALQLLSDLGDPALLATEPYMHYVVTQTQARYMNYQNITTDTAILEAQRYFVRHNNFEMAARASFYAASYWSEKEVEDQALKCYIQSSYYSKEANNPLFEAKSTYWIGNIFYNQDLLDSAVIYYEKAFKLYKSQPESEKFQLGLIYMLGRSYWQNQNVTQADEYITMGLKLAQAFKDEEYEALFLHYKGVILRDQNQYSKAKCLFNLALAIKQVSENELRVYLDYARLYKATHQPDSVKYYLDRVHSRLAHISYPYTRRAVYEELTAYYKTENPHEAMRFSELGHQEDLHIRAMHSEEKLLQVAKEFETFKQEAQQKEARMWWLNFWQAVSLLAILVVLGGVVYRMRSFGRFFAQLRTRMTLQKFDQQKILTNSYLVASKGEAAVRAEIERNYPGVSSQVIWESFEKQRIQINELFSQWARLELEKYRNGKQAISKLTTEDLCLMYLCHLKYSGEKILYMLGYPFYSENYMQQRKQAIRQRLAEAGVSTREQDLLVPPICYKQHAYPTKVPGSDFFNK